MSSNALRLLILAVAVASPLLAENPEKDLGNRLKARYKGTRLIVMVGGFYAGEYKQAVRAREDFVNWWHYDESTPVKRQKSVSDQIDDRTLATPPAFGGNGLGSNVFPIAKGEALLVSNMFFECSRGLCTLKLFLDTAKLSKTAALDPRKATGDTNPLLLESAGLGCEFNFVFAQESIARPAAQEMIVAAVSRYLQPSDQAQESLRAQKNVEIEIGATEEEVIAKLGEPLKTVRVGSQKTLKYPDMTVILKDGKVADVKVE